MANPNSKKLKILILGDSHGTEHWLNHDFSMFNKIISLGDWYDNWENDWTKIDQIKNQERFLDLQRKEPDKFIMLMGNHCLHYLIPQEEYSGKQVHKQWDIHDFLYQHKKEFRIAYQLKDYIFSHAGLSSQWMEIMKIESVDKLNSCLWNGAENLFSFYPWDSSMCGNSYYQGPLWIRPQALCEVPWRNYNQVVGHTSNKGPNGVAEFTMKNGKKLIVVDNMEHTAYLEMEI